MNYHDLKIAHIFFAVLSFSMATALFYGGSSKGRQILFALANLLLLASGFVVMGRFGIQHAPPWPLWINVKLGIWLALAAATPLVAKRFPKRAKSLFWPWMIMALFASAMAVYKPMG